MDASTLTVFMAAVSTIIAGLVGAVTYLFHENKKLTRDIGECQEDRVRLNGDIVSLNVQIEMMQWKGLPGSEAIVVANMLTGTIIEWNPVATVMMHYTEREILGKSIMKIIPERYREQHNKGMESLRGTELTKRGPIVGHALRKGGGEIPVNIFLSMWKDGPTAYVAAKICRREEASNEKDSSS